MQPLLAVRYLPAIIDFYRKTKTLQPKILEPFMQATEVNLLLFIMRLTRAINIETAWFGVNAGQFV